MQHRECPKQARWWFHLGYWGRSDVPAYTARRSAALRLLTTPSSRFLLRSTAGRFVSISAHSPNLALNGAEGEMCWHRWFSLRALNPARSLEYLVQHLEENGASIRTTWLNQNHGQQHGSNKRHSKTSYQLFLSEHLPFIGQQSCDAELLSPPGSNRFQCQQWGGHFSVRHQSFCMREACYECQFQAELSKSCYTKKK